METESVTATWSADAFVSAAEAVTGLSDWGEEAFRDGLQRIVDAFNQESRTFGLTEDGVDRDRRDLANKLEERLRLVDWRKKHPEIAQERIDSPLFVVGMPRSGTTLAHRLLTTDPASRYLASWEMRFPTPPPRRETYHSDPRIRLAAEWLHDSGMSDNNFGSMHEFGAQLPDECQHFFKFTCRATSQAANIAKPSFFRWLDTGDMLPAYVFHKKVLQHLQSGYRGDYWVLKSPQHVMHMTELLEVYPDAKIVVMHRDPRKVMASTVSIATKMQWLSQTRVDFQVEFDKYLEVLPNSMDEVERFSTDARYARQFINVHFDDLTEDPIGTVARIRTQFGLGFDPSIKALVSAYMLKNPRGKKGEHRYSLDELGVDPRNLDDAFAGYLGRLNSYRTR